MIAQNRIVTAASFVTGRRHTTPLLSHSKLCCVSNIRGGERYILCWIKEIVVNSVTQQRDVKSFLNELSAPDFSSKVLLKRRVEGQAPETQGMKQNKILM